MMFDREGRFLTSVEQQELDKSWVASEVAFQAVLGEVVRDLAGRKHFEAALGLARQAMPDEARRQLIKRVTDLMPTLDKLALNR